MDMFKVQRKKVGERKERRKRGMEGGRGERETTDRQRDREADRQTQTQSVPFVMLGLSVFSEGSVHANLQCLEGDLT